MITLIRWVIYKSKEIKWKCALWVELDKQSITFIKNPEEIEKKLLPFLAQIIHDESIKETAKEVMGTFGEK